MLRGAMGVFFGHGRFPKQQSDMYLGPLYATAGVATQLVWLCLPSLLIASSTLKMTPSFPTLHHTLAVAWASRRHVLTGVSCSPHQTQWTHEHLCQYKGCDSSAKEWEPRTKGRMRSVLFLPSNASCYLWRPPSLQCTEAVLLYNHIHSIHRSQ